MKLITILQLKTFFHTVFIKYLLVKYFIQNLNKSFSLMLMFHRIKKTLFEKKHCMIHDDQPMWLYLWRYNKVQVLWGSIYVICLGIVSLLSCNGRFQKKNLLAFGAFFCNSLLFFIIHKPTGPTNLTKNALWKSVATTDTSWLSVNICDCSFKHKLIPDVGIIK